MASRKKTTNPSEEQQDAAIAEQQRQLEALKETLRQSQEGIDKTLKTIRSNDERSVEIKEQMSSLNLAMGALVKLLSKRK